MPRPQVGVKYHTGKQILFNDGSGGIGVFYLGTITYVAPEFLMVSYVKNSKVVTIRISYHQVQTQI
jgi:hypothetical protein